MKQNLQAVICKGFVDNFADTASALQLLPIAMVGFGVVAPVFFQPQLALVTVVEQHARVRQGNVVDGQNDCAQRALLRLLAHLENLRFNGRQ